MRWPIYQASHILHAGGVIAYPTEAVWGIGCDPDNPQALRKVIELKRREQDKGLILIASHIHQFDFLLSDLPAEDFDRMNQRWPGPVTWLVPHQNKVHPLVHGRFDTVAIRVSDHPIVRQLCNEFNGPIVSTSANLSGRPPARNPIQLRQHLGFYLDFIVPGPLGGLSKPSQIIDLKSGRILRG